MIPTPTILRVLYRSHPFPLPEASFMSEIKQDGGKPVGEKEFTDGLKRVESRGWITMERNADNDPLWSLTPTGYAEAKFQSR